MNLVAATGPMPVFEKDGLAVLLAIGAGLVWFYPKDAR
jgi:hypothetical protein